MTSVPPRMLPKVPFGVPHRFIPMVRSLKADGAIALMDVQEQDLNATSNDLKS